jgi:uncharacterized membrane protein
MKVMKLVALNDRRIGSLILFVFSIQAAVLGLVALDHMNLGLPIVRATVFFVYLNFLPGVLLLRILKVHEIGGARTLLYSVGLSIVTVMVAGVFANFTYPAFGIRNPISEVPMVITMSALTVLLCVVCYARDRDYSVKVTTELTSRPYVPAMFLAILPIGAAIGAYAMNNWHTNIILMLLLLVISAVPVLVSLGRFIPTDLYPLAIVSISLSLLFHSSLISNYIWGWDIQYEYHLAGLIVREGVWDPGIGGNLNGMLSVTMLAPILSVLLSMNLVWIFKIVFPMVFSLVPLGLYLLIRAQLNPRAAFLSVFIFVSLFTFYTEMVQLARQQAAELFLILLLLMLLEKSIARINRSALAIVFAFALAVSHYGLSYVFMILLSSALIIDWTRLKKNADPKQERLSARFVFLFVLICVVWYANTSSGTSFQTGVLVARHIADSIFTDFLSPETAQGLSTIASETPSFLHEFSKYMHLLVQVLIVFGVAYSWFNRRKQETQSVYLSLSVASLALMFAAIAVPYFASSLNVARLYQIALIFLVPYSFVGWKTVGKLFVASRIRKPSAHGTRLNVEAFSVFSIFVAVFLLFNSGLVYEVAQDHPTSISLNNGLDSPLYNARDIQAGKWLAKNEGSQTTYADTLRFQLLTGLGIDFSYLPNNSRDMLEGTFVFMGTYNTVNQRVLCAKEYMPIEPFVVSQSRVYDNGGAQIFV